MVAGVAVGTIPLTPVIAGAAVLTPILMHMAHKSNSRQNELINDRFAAIAMGTPVPVARAFALHSRGVKQGRLVGKFAPPLPDESGIKENNFERALRWLEAVENFGPIATHPSGRTRRKKLAELRKKGLLKPQESKTKILRAMLG